MKRSQYNIALIVILSSVILLRHEQYVKLKVRVYVLNSVCFIGLLNSIPS